MTDYLMSASGAVTLFIAGFVVGALLMQWRTAKTLLAINKRGATPMLWDIHSVLNVMNKLAMTSERGRAVEPALIYLLSDYLLHSALIQREDGWADRNALESWLLAHIRVVADQRGQNVLPPVNIEMPNSIRRIQARLVLREILWRLQKTRTVQSIHIKVLAPKAGHQRVLVRIEVECETVDLSDFASQGSTSSSWRTEAGLSTCELRTAFELGTA